MAASINAYLEGNRVRVTAECVIDSNHDGNFDQATDPSTVKFIVHNIDTGVDMIFYHAPPAGDTIPPGVNALFTNPAVGTWEIIFDVDAPGLLVIAFFGTGACKASAETAIRVTPSRAKGTE